MSRFPFKEVPLREDLSNIGGNTLVWDEGIAIVLNCLDTFCWTSFWVSSVLQTPLSSAAKRLRIRFKKDLDLVVRMRKL